MRDERVLLVDASVIITLARIDAFGLLDSLEGGVVVPQTVVEEVDSEPAQSTLAGALGSWIGAVDALDECSGEDRTTARTQLGHDDEQASGDLALLTYALHRSDRPTVVVTDDKPLRQTCKALSIPVSGSIGVLIRAVERDALAPGDAKDKLLAMDEVGARLSASLLRRAEQLIDDASG